MTTSTANPSDTRPVSQHLANLECALLSEVEPVRLETKMECLAIVREKVEPIIGSAEVFEEIQSILGFDEDTRANRERIKELLNILTATAASLLE